LIRILLVEDNPADAYLLERFLAKVDRDNFNLTKVESSKEAISFLLNDTFDIILLDLSLPDSQGLETVRKVYQSAKETPIVVLTGLDDEAIATAALREGAQDYIIKGEMSPHTLVRSLHYAIERQQILDKLKQLNEQLIRSNKELEQFAYVVSHDLQQPLQNIMGFSQLLLHKYKDLLDPKGQHYLNHIVKAASRMGQLIKDLLVYSRIGNSPQETIVTDCNQVLNIVLNNLQRVIEETNATVIYEELPSVKVGAGQLVQLFQNLLDNSIKYRSIEIEPKISLKTKRRGNKWVFCVEDNGIGIDKSDRERIFEMFQRLSHSENLPGTGIGLAICKKIVEYHGGKIWVKSQVSQGTQFYFTLPAA
jgi:two-component system sensor histidine kinase/response regulator